MMIPHGCLRRAVFRSFGVTDFAAAVGTSQSSVSYILSGQRGLNDKQAKKWAEVLGLRGLAARRFRQIATLTKIDPELRGDIFRGLMTAWLIEERMSGVNRQAVELRHLFESVEQGSDQEQ